MTTVEKNTKEQVKKNLRYERDKGRELVTGKFVFHEVPNGSLSFVFKAYKEDQVERFDFIDGMTYKIPLTVAKHLNKNGWYPVHHYARDEDGKPSMRIGKKVRRFSFVSLDFMDIDEVPTHASPIIEVTHI